MKLVFSELAEQDLDGIAVFVAENSGVDRALALVDEMRERMKLLRSTPHMGRAGVEPGTRELVIGSYVVPYRVAENVVEILRVWHGRQRSWG